MTLLRARPRRTLAATAVTAMLMVPTSANAVQPGIPAPAPASVPTAAAGTLEYRYEANRRNIEEAARLAEIHGARSRAEALRSMADPQRQFLSFDAKGAGRAVEVLGDLAHAERISVLVPGADTTLDTYDSRGPARTSSLGAGASALYGEAHRQDPHIQVAVVAWLGYDTPDLVSLDALTTSRAENAADGLREFIMTLRRANPRAEIAVLGHSYGAVVVGRAAARGLAVTDIAVYGSPGLGVSTAADLSTDAELWAARGSNDWAASLPNLTINLFGTSIGFGADPTDRDFGARTFDAGDAGHGDYLKPGSASLHNLARIALGRGITVSHG